MVTRKTFLQSAGRHLLEEHGSRTARNRCRGSYLPSC